MVIKEYRNKEDKNDNWLKIGKKDIENVWFIN